MNANFNFDWGKWESDQLGMFLRREFDDYMKKAYARCNYYRAHHLRRKRAWIKAGSLVK